MRFKPKAKDSISITLNGAEFTFRVASHPDPQFQAVRFPHAMSGELYTIWHIQYRGDVEEDYGLKVANSRHPNRAVLKQVCARLDTLKDIEGLECCDRLCLSPELAAPTIAQYADLEYAILMPWIRGTSWFDAHQDHERTRAFRSLTRWECIELAHRMVCVLTELESRGILHCALCPENLMVDLTDRDVRVELLGLEDILAPGLTEEHRPRLRLPGYSHPAYAHGAVDISYDRFPGALLLSEVLGWFDEGVRKLCSAESYFDPDELQSESCERMRVLEDALSQHHSELAALFVDAWRSPSPEGCPPLARWRETLERVMRTRIQYTWLAREQQSSAPCRMRRCWTGHLAPESRELSREADRGSRP